MRNYNRRILLSFFNLICKQKLIPFTIYKDTINVLLDFNQILFVNIYQSIHIYIHVCVMVHKHIYMYT